MSRDDVVLARQQRPSSSASAFTPSMPYRSACFRWSQSSAENSIALVGMQPQSRQVPPRPVVCVNQSGLEAILRGADGAGIPGGAAAKHYYIKNRICQRELSV